MTAFNCQHWTCTSGLGSIYLCRSTFVIYRDQRPIIMTVQVQFTWCNLSHVSVYCHWICGNVAIIHINFRSETLGRGTKSEITIWGSADCDTKCAVWHYSTAGVLLCKARIMLSKIYMYTCTQK